MYETLSLSDAVILTCKGSKLSRVRPNGSGLLAFEFDDVTEQQASHILNSADAAVCRAFHRAWRAIRREMDAVQVHGGRR